MLLASEQSERDTLSRSLMENAIRIYIYIYIYIYLYHLSSLLMHAIGPKVWIK